MLFSISIILRHNTMLYHEKNNPELTANHGNRKGRSSYENWKLWSSPAIQLPGG